KLLACDTPAALKERIGGDVVTVTSRDPEAVRATLKEQLGVDASIVDGVVRLERAKGPEFVPQLVEAARGLVESVSVGKPTLQDVFIRMTGQRFAADPDAPSEVPRKRGG